VQTDVGKLKNVNSLYHGGLLLTNFLAYTVNVKTTSLYATT